MQERDRLLDEKNVYKIKKEELERTLLEKKIAMKAMTPSLVDLESSVIPQETHNILVVKTIVKFLSYSFQNTTSGGRATNKFRIILRRFNQNLSPMLRKLL